MNIRETPPETIPSPPKGGSGVTPPTEWPTVNGSFVAGFSTGTRRTICPDLLRLSDLGEADGWRGRTVRGFFHLLGLVTGL